MKENSKVGESMVKLLNYLNPQAVNLGQALEVKFIERNISHNIFSVKFSSGIERKYSVYNSDLFHEVTKI